jgi:hypothetical protein
LVRIGTARTCDRLRTFLQKRTKSLLYSPRRTHQYRSNDAELVYRRNAPVHPRFIGWR